MRLPPRASPPARALGLLQAWALDHGVKALRLWLGVVYFWFGALKFDATAGGEESSVPGRAVAFLTLRLLDETQGAQVLAYWECLIGFCLVAGLWLRTASLLMLAHMLVMFLPMVLMPRQIWESFPLLPTIKGQMILDNLALIACAMMLASSVPRGPPRRFLGRPGRWLRTWDERASSWLGHHGILLLRICLGTLFLWQGALKFVPGGSSLEPILVASTAAITGTESSAGLFLIGAWELLIGLVLLTGRAPRAALGLILLHLLLSCAPFLLAPDEVWTSYPFALTLAGKFTVRHLALGTAALIVAASIAQRASGWSARVNPFLGAAGRHAEGAGRLVER